METATVGGRVGCEGKGGGDDGRMGVIKGMGNRREWEDVSTKKKKRSVEFSFSWKQ